MNAAEVTYKNDISIPKELENQVIETEIIIDELLGEAFFGQTFKGHYRHILGLTLVLKKLSKYDEDAFVNEALIMKEIEHDNIVKFHGIYKDEHLYIVTEYGGENLKSYLDNQIKTFITQGNIKVSNNLIIKDFVDIALDITSSMVYLSEKGIIHRDLRIDNALITILESKKSGEKRFFAKLIDFGLSRELSSNKDNIYQSCQTNHALPLNYFAPEVAEHNKYSTESDVWSFGIFLWQLFSVGCANKIHNTSEPLSHNLPQKQIPSEIYEIIENCCVVDPQNRISFKDIQNKLNEILKSPVIYDKVCVDIGDIVKPVYFVRSQN